MDMDMPSGTPWIDMPIMFHSSREYSCSLNNTELCAYQQGYWRFWYQADHRYALPTVAFFMTAIILFSLAYILSEVLPTRVLRTTTARRVIAINRWLSYRSWRISALNWNSAPLGVLLLAAVGVIFFFSMVLGPKPYYWPWTRDIHWGDSPPLATRSGWMSLACLPFVFATAGKSNLISMVTGVSYEKLQVFHRWISYAMFVLALLHTFPFIVFNIWSGDMVMSWNTSVFYWTGVVALLAQAYLTFASIGPLRNLCYEWFKFSHFVAGLVFTLFLFFHCDFTLTSVDYFIATGVLFALSWLHRQVRVYFEHGVGHQATLSISPNGFVKVTVPTHASWRAGQHFFVRFMTLGLHSWTMHPFTACSLPARGSSQDGGKSDLVFYIRPQGGFTARLARMVEARPESQIRVVIDGPYGGVDMQKIAAPDRSLVIVGGSGAGWALPLIGCFLRKLQLQTVEKQQELNLRVVLATRDRATQMWFEKVVAEELARCPVDTLSQEQLQVEIHYTGSEDNVNAPKLTGQFLQKLDDPEKVPDVNETSSTSDASSKELKKLSHVRYVDHRPGLRGLVAEECNVTGPGGSLGVFVCGPLSMQSDVANAVAKQQMSISKSGSKDLYLHMEHFSWA